MFVNRFLSYDSKNTGGVYGVLIQLSYLVNLYNPTYIAFFGDKYPLKRQKIFPAYKEKRHQKKDEEFVKIIKENRNYILGFLEYLGIPFVEIVGFEADDLIAANALYNQHNFNVVIASNDDDLYFLLNEDVSIHKSKGLYTYDTFKSEYPDLDPISDWTIFRALTGNHNEVPPLFRGCGPKTALKLLKDKDSLQEVIEANKETFNRNIQLVTYPYSTLLYNEVHLPMKQFRNRRTLENKLMTEYGINLTSAMEEAFTKIGSLV